MRRRPMRLLRFTLFAGIALGIALVAAPRAGAQRYPVHVYMETEHLPSSNVHGMAQASDGRMWFGLRTGVVWYDGSEWHACHEEEGLPAQSFGPIVASTTGVVRAILRELPLRCYEWRDEVWTLVSRDEVEDAEASPFREVILAAGIGDELLVADSDSRLYRMHEGRWHDVAAGSWTRVYGVTTLGDAYFIAADTGLFTLPAATDVARRVASDELPPGPIRSVAASRDGQSLWVVGDDWIGRLVADGFVALGDGLRELGDIVAATVACAGPSGGLYFGYGGRLFYFHPDSGVDEMQRKNGLSGDGVTALTLDRDGSMWVASLRGVTKILGRHLAAYDAEAGLVYDEVSAVLLARSGEVVLGYEGALSVGFPDCEKISIGGEVPGRRVIDLEEDSQGRVWCAAMMRGLACFDENWNAVWYLEQRAKRHPVTSVVEHRDGSIWAGTEHGIFRFDGETFESVPLTDSPATEPYVRRLLATSWGSIVVGTVRDGIYEVGPDGVEQRTSGDRDADSVYSLFEDAPGVVLVGTLDGVMRAEGDSYARPADCSAELRRPVYSITRDHQGSTWLGTDRGFRIVRQGTLHELLPRDGLLGVEANRDAAVVDEAGRVWLGTDRGLTIYDRSLEPTDIPPPLLTLLDIVTDAGVRPADVDVKFEHRLDDLVFRFRAIAFRDERRVRFRTRLEGLEDEWRDPVPYPQREVRYANLLPGRYRFEVQAIDAEGGTSEIARSAYVHIRPAWWARRVTIAGLFVFLAVIAWGVAAHMMQRRYSRRLESTVEARSRELDAMHEEIAKSQKLEAVGLLAGGIAHDFNNLLTGILGNLSLSQSSATDPRVAREAIDRAVAATHRARGLTQQLLTFSRGGTPVREAAGIADLLRESADFVLHGSPVEARIEIADDLHDVDIDVGQMAQVIQNLLLNARQAVEDGGCVTLEAYNVDTPAGEGRRVCIEVRDEGPGIDPENLARVFDPYFTTKPNGSGLGLAIAHSIVRHHEGRITVRSTPGAGAAFRVELPAASRSEAAATPPASAKARTPNAARTARVLAMDDEDFVRDVLEEMLAQLGYDVEVVSRGEEAVASYERAMREDRPFDAVIMDLTVRGGMGGREALAKIRAIDPDVRAIVASGYSDDDTLADPDAYGFVEALPKPFVLRDLAEALERLLHEPNARR